MNKINKYKPIQTNHQRQPTAKREKKYLAKYIYLKKKQK